MHPITEDQKPVKPKLWAVYYSNNSAIVCTSLSRAFTVAAEYAKNSDEVKVEEYPEEDS